MTKFIATYIIMPLVVWVGVFLFFSGVTVVAYWSFDIEFFLARIAALWMAILYIIFVIVEKGKARGYF